MDKQATIGFILIIMILMTWLWLAAPPAPSPSQQRADTTKQVPTTTPQTPLQTVSTPAEADTLGKWFSGLPQTGESFITVETDLYRAIFTSRGGLLKEWTLKKYNTWDGHPVELVDYKSGGDLSLLFTTTDGKLMNTRSLPFIISGGSRTITLSGNDEATFRLDLPLKNGRMISKIFTLKNDSYSFTTVFQFTKMADVISNYEYQIVWEDGLRLTERNSVDEASYASADAYIGGELVKVDATDFTKEEKSDLTGATDWVGMKNKYFVLAMIPQGQKGSGCYLDGVREHADNNGIKENYAVALKVPYTGADQESFHTTIFLGPLDYHLLKSYNVELQKIMNFGIEWLIRPISIYFMLPLFDVIRAVIPNYGLVIIVFTLIIRVLLYPLMKTSMKSMKKMQQLQPFMDEIKTKYKDEPERMNREVMKLYKDYGVNPASGCLPVLLQLPILYALWAVFSTAISLRQASFIWWIKDLSIPDSIMTLPFTIPIFGGNHVSGLALFMGATMIIQQRMTPTNPQQKAMMWVLPIVMTLAFNNFPAGLNLYYAVFNITAIVQQYWMNHRGGNEPLRKVDPKNKRGGIMSKLAASLPTTPKKK